MFSMDIFMIVLFIIYGVLGRELETRVTDFCEFETFRASCGQDEVIEMRNASYGRMRLGTCVVNDLGYIGCKTDVLDIADRKCSGRRSCEIAVPDQDMAARTTCLAELKLYLEATYTCRKILSVEKSQCQRCDYVKLTEPSGVIGSVITAESSCGSPDCPWLITVKPGQRINVTLINYSWRKTGAQHNGDTTGCRVYGTIKEDMTTRSTTICGGDQRVKHVYQSITNSLQLRIVGKDNPDNNEYFLFEYTAVGCADPTPPSGGYMQRSGDVVIMGCNHTGSTSKMVCSGYQWEGDTLMCGDGTEVLGLMENKSSLPFGLSIGVIFAVAIVIGAIILLIGLIIVRRRRNMERSQMHMYSSPTDNLPPPYKDTMYPSTYPHSGQHQIQNYEPTQFSRKDITDTGSAEMWERPLPEQPDNSIEDPNFNNAYKQIPGSIHYGYNTITSIKTEPTGTPTGNTKSKSSPKSGTETGQEYGNHTMARKGCPGDEIDDPRYFQLDPDKPQNIF